MRTIDMKHGLIVLAIAVAGIFTGVAYAQVTDQQAGQVIVAVGNFQAVKANNAVQPLQRGDYFYSGEILKTGKDSDAQVRFTDGTVLALTPNSELKVDSYIYQKNPKTDRSMVTLIKGGFRALTGLISKENADAYKVETPVAVIGVRGTNYGATLDKGQLYAGVWKGGIFVKNNGGLIKLSQSDDYRFAMVANRNSAPIGLLNPPRQLVGQCSMPASE